MAVRGICRLCRQERDLRESHVFPKFVFDWIKRDSGPYLRAGENPNLRLQDGFKEHLLCGECEGCFNPAETWFSRVIFRAFMDSFELEFDYGPELFRFLVSVHWRVLTTFLNKHENAVVRFREGLLEAEEQWRLFLLHGAPLPEYREVHLLFLDVHTGDHQPVPNLNRYLVNAVDGVVVRSGSRCAVYSKFLRFLSYSWITPINRDLWINTGVHPAGGHLSAKQEMNDADAGAAIFDRARRIGERFSQTISDRQQAKINQWFLDNAEEFLQSDLARALQADFSAEVDPMFGRAKRIGRNEPCPCGSGRKYKMCCET